MVIEQRQVLNPQVERCVLEIAMRVELADLLEHCGTPDSWEAMVA